ncbi:MAG: glycosyltransferase [Campylobacteraceae bacterium]|jgi:rhamnosyltransferase|nr:glycosyltransferase [Campylobacteraceae bacterium]
MAQDDKVKSAKLPLIAILLAAYNGKRYIKEQIDSILEQKGVKVNIFVSIDISTDNTREYLIEKYSNNHSVILLDDIGRFGDATKNFMRLVRDVDFSHYDFVSFADQDDVWYPNKLSRAVQMIYEQGCFGYSSNVLAFWESGKEKMIVKSQPQVKYDYLFEAAGAGCTYVMAQKLAHEFKKCVTKNFNSVNDLWSHDWFCYAFARANGFKWYIDDFCSMRYRQHINNQIGANSGFVAFKNRVKTVLFNNAFEQPLKIANLIGLKNDPFVIKWSKLGRLDMLKLAFYANQCRRKIKDKILFFVACILLAIKSR